MPRVIHFEIAADEPERAIRFYESVFGWEIQKWDGPIDYWLIMTGPKDEPGIDGGLGKRNRPEEHTTNTIDVDSLDDYIQKIQESGGSVVSPKHAVPGVGYMAYCADTEGNVFGIMEENPAAQ
jgi:predicted enzyme related to lactoylglutathione lyase